AHTIKGSSRVMGLIQMGHAGALLEHAWKRIETGELAPTGAAVRALETLAALLPEAAEQEQHGSTRRLQDEITRTEVALHGGSPSEDRVPLVLAAQERELEPEGGPTSLGGLLGAVERSMMSGASRVDTIDLYQLINQAVEVSLDSEALSDLALVQFVGADPHKLLSAWRSQLRRLVAAVGHLQDLAVALANAPLRQATETFPQFVRYLGRKLGKDVRFDASGEEIELDRQIVELLREPLRHLLVNAVDHGLETPEERIAAGKSATGVVSLSARRDGDRVIVVVSDDGRGVDWKAVSEAARQRGLALDDSDLTSLLFQPGFTTVDAVHDFSGAGDGLTTVAEVLERMNGGIQFESQPGLGTTVTLTLPVSLVLQNVVVVADGDNFWGLPEAAVQASIMPAGSDLTANAAGVRRARFQSQDLPVVSLATAMGQEPQGDPSDLVIVSTRSGPVAVGVGEVLGRRRVAVKALGPILGGSRNITGAALLGGGEVMVVVDPHYLGEFARHQQRELDRRWKVLVVDDSAGVRQLIAATLSGRGFEVQVAESAREAVLALANSSFDVLVVDYAMPRSNGVELVRALRAGNVKVPIVMVSGVASAEEQAAAWEAGVDAYLDKSDLRLGALLSTLHTLLEGPAA
ncbi:MAG TPA: response regulator, partial [Acidimicrobiia bacterium]|nr:response regulator [Acidimicrobiia bacterium]